MTRRVAGVALAVAAIVGGCRSVPPPPLRAPVPTRPSWVAAPAADADAVARPPQDGPDLPAPLGWVARFGEPALVDVVSEALAANRDLVAAAHRLAAARALVRGARGERIPTVSASTSASRQRRNFIGLPVPGGERVLSSTATGLEAGVDVSWEIDLWGRLGHAERAARRDADALASDLEAARLSIAAAAVRAWFAVAEASDQLELARRIAQHQETIAAAIRRRYERGLTEALDVRLAESDLERARADVRRRELELANRRRALEVLLGRYPAAGIGADPAPHLSPPPPPPPAGLPVEILERRPDLRAARQRVLAARERAAAARSARWPRLTLTTGGGTASSELSDLLDGDFRVWNLAAGVLGPIFQGGRLAAQEEHERERAEAALAGWAQAVLDALREVEDALDAEAALAEMERRERRAAEEALAARDLAELRYRDGLADVLVVLEARARADRAAARVLELQRARLDNRVALHLALGGDFAVARDDAP